MTELREIQARYMRDPLPVRLGGLAADLARIASFGQNPANAAAVADLVREAAHFAEWCARDSDLQRQLALLELQRRLACWRRGLPNGLADAAWRGRVIAEAQRWSDQVLDMSGLLTERAHASRS